MSKRITPRNHVIGAFSWSVAALAGLWPCLPGIGTVDPRKPITFIELVRYSDGWLGVVVVGGLAGLLVMLLHLLSAFDLWIDERAMRKGGIQGNWRATRLGIAASLAFLALAAGCWTADHNLRVDGRGNYLAMVEECAVRSGVAWHRLAEDFERVRPSDRLLLPTPGTDPLPALQALARSPVVEEPFYLSPQGQLTLLADNKPYRFELRSLLQKVAAADALFKPGPPSPRLRPPGEFQATNLARAFMRPGMTMLHWPYPGFHATMDPPFGQPIYSKGKLRHGVLGYRLSQDYIDIRATNFLRELNLPCRWESGFRTGYTYVFPPSNDDGPHVPAGVYLEDDLSEPTAHLQNTLMALAALVLLFFASVVETARQLRSLVAERAMQMAQSSFVSGVSHEMRTPLTTVRLYAELLEQGLDKTPVERLEFARAIQFEVDRLHRLIENVLDFARISGRKRTYSFVPTDLRGVIDEALQAARGQLAAAGLRYEVHMPTPLTASLDRDAIVQALVNLLSNAAKYGASGSQVVLSALPDAQGGIVLAVEDFGPGIPRHERVKIFHPFYRIAGQAMGGTGLGLALVTEYARAHGGHVTVDSPPGHGATFSLHLPEDPTLARPAQASPRRPLRRLFSPALQGDRDAT